MKLTKHDRRLIAKIAKSLPSMNHKHETVRQIVRGSSVLDRNPLATLGDTGTPISANKSYVTGDIPKEVNHKKELEKAFLKYGEIGLATYQKSILQIALNANQNY